MSTYLNVIRWWLVARSFKGLCHIAKNLHWWKQVSRVEVLPLCEIKQVFGDLRHAIPRQHPLALRKVALNLQEQEKTELGASVSSNISFFFFLHSMQSQTFRVNGAQRNQEERLYSLRSFIRHLYLRQAEMYCALQIFWNESIWIKMLTGAENTHLGRNCAVKRHFTLLCNCVTVRSCVLQCTVWTS